MRGRGRGVGTLGVALALLAALLAGCAPTTGATTAHLPTLALPAALAGDHLFITDLLTGDVAELGQRTFRVGKSVHGLGLAPDGRTLYVTDVAGNALVAYAVLPGGRLGAARRVVVGAAPVHVVQTPSGLLFVTNFGESSVSVVDAARWRVRATITVPASPHGIVLAPDGRTAYVACANGGAVAALDAASQALTWTLPLPDGARPYSVALSGDGRYLYAADNFAARLFVIDTAARQIIGTVPIGLRAALMARSADGATLYISNGASGTVSVLDLASDPAHPTVRATVRVGTYPHGLALTADGRYLVVANTLGDTLSVIATATDTVIATIAGERYPNDVLALP
ncbi:MAG TPA: beta-propeller fold lactonase family protein [Ktedonobacterales bacterium]|nr:beta-propeller fold lactonase family protein [Ktedonobacterales bacterium]